MIQWSFNGREGGGSGREEEQRLWQLRLRILQIVRPEMQPLGQEAED